MLGVAVSVALGIAGGAVTVTVAVAVRVPAALVAASVYVVVGVGETVCDPLVATLAPFKVTVVASADVQSNLDDWPR